MDALACCEIREEEDGGGQRVSGAARSLGPALAESTAALAEMTRRLGAGDAVVVDVGRRTAALAAFLKVHEPDGPPVTDYMAKVTDARKFGLVATKLLAKFPKAVWPQPDPQPDKKHRIGGDGAAFDPLAESLRLLEGEARESAATEASLLDLDAAERPEL